MPKLRKHRQVYWKIALYNGIDPKHINTAYGPLPQLKGSIRHSTIKTIRLTKSKHVSARMCLAIFWFHLISFDARVIGKV